VRLVAILLVLSATAWADPGERCAAGVAAAKKGDLSHAALYLDGCDDAQLPAELAADVARASRELRKKLETSELSVLEVVTRPPGLAAEIDALPGEQLTTPVTIYIPAGTHQVRAGSLTSSVTTKPHARSVVYLDAKAPAVAPPKDGKVDFNEDSGGEATAEVAPPPDQKHKPLTPCKYTNSCTEAGAPIDDPLARRELPPPLYPASAFELRAGSVYANGLGPVVGVAFAHLAPWEDVGAEHPFVWSVRGDWSLKHDGHTFGATLALAKVIAAPDTAWLSLGAGARYDSSLGVEGTALVELALRWLPVSLGARYEQSVERAMDGSLPRAFVLELGYALRVH
jgi:hypothetical protein